MPLPLRFLLVCALASPLAGQVTINEFVYDDSTADDREFVELYNAGAQPVDLSNWMLECLDGAYPNDDNPDYPIPPGAMIPAGGFYVMGSALVPNVDLVIGIMDIFENGAEALVLRDSGGLVQDQVAYETTKIGSFFPPQFLEGDGFWGAVFSTDVSYQSTSRWADGLDSDNNGRDFGLLPATPGQSNLIATSNSYAETFDGLTVESNAPGWRGSQVNPRVVDPTTVSTSNINVVPASPQGGEAMVVYRSQGGVSAMFEGAPAQDMIFEAWVWLETGASCPNFQCFSIGLRGTAATLHVGPEPDLANRPCGGTFTAQSNGNTGIAWEYFNLDGAGKLYLVDENDGGPDQTILAEFDVMAGVNDGWQRLRLEVHGDLVLGHFGGTYGSTTNGLRVAARTSTIQTGTAYLGHFESFADNSGIRHLLVDDVRVEPSTTPPAACFWSSPWPGGFQLELEGLELGRETYTLMSSEPCPAGVGTGLLLGLCATDLTPLIAQVNTPLGTVPFHFLPASPTLVFGPLSAALIPSGFTIEAVYFQIDQGNITAVSNAARYVNP